MARTLHMDSLLRDIFKVDPPPVPQINGLVKEIALKSKQQQHHDKIQRRNLHPALSPNWFGLCKRTSKQQYHIFVHCQFVTTMRNPITTYFCYAHPCDKDISSNLTPSFLVQQNAGWRDLNI